MDIRKIETVCAVDTYRSYTEAAFQISSSESVISKHVNAVEKELGIKIFERAAKARSVELTPAGEKIIGHFHAIVRQYELIRKQLEQEPRGFQTLTIGLCSHIGSFMESTFAGGFQIANPNVTVILTRANSVAELVNSVIAGKTDAVFIAVIEDLEAGGSDFAPLRDENIAATEIMHMSKMTIGVSSHHHFAEYKEIPRNEFYRLHNEVFLMSYSERRKTDLTIHLRRKLGMTSAPKLRYVDFTDRRMALDLVEIGAGVLPQMCIVPPALENVRFIPLEGDSGTKLTLYLFCRKDNQSPQLQQFKQYVSQTAPHYYSDYPFVHTP